MARPDKISGADINSICQEVRLMHIMYFLVFHRLVKREVTVCFFNHVINFLFSSKRLACWQYVRIDTSSWQKTLKKLTRLSSKKMSKSMSSTSREESYNLQKVSMLTFVFVSVY